MKRIFALVAVVLFVTSCSSHSSRPDELQQVPWSFQGTRSMNPPVELPAGGASFDFPNASGSVGYLVRSPVAKSLTTITINGEVVTTGAPTFNFRTEVGNTGDTPANFRLYFQRLGDNFTGAGDFQYYRWWQRAGVTLAPGEFQSVGDLSNPSGWSSVMGVAGDASPEAVAAFREAAQNVGLIGITFGGGFFYGHGVFVDGGTGTATFKINSFVESRP